MPVFAFKGKDAFKGDGFSLEELLRPADSTEALRGRSIDFSNFSVSDEDEDEDNEDGE